ncbi:MAG TPA: tetratricopeptide repeat protein [Candidatus Angelobacter sp.]|jgi:tetratricopeptide (TPR) repeat protein|nr:tetratricopeptide repeat protein [Candidatus Angelobacter sp.]
MTIYPKSLAGACCILSFLVGSSGALAQATVTRTHIPAPKDPANASLAAAQEAMERKDYAAAVTGLQDYLAKEPRDAAAHFQLGYAYTALRRSDDAKAEYEKAVALKPDMPEAQLNLGITLLDANPQAAVSPLQKAADLMPAQARPKFLLGMAFERANKLASAIEQYQAAEKIDDKDFAVRFALGRALLGSERASDAEPEFRAALELRSDYAPAHLGLAQSLFEQKKPEAAAAEYAVYLQLQPDDNAARMERASVLADAGKNDDALAELDRAAATGPEGLRALKLRSFIDFQKKRYDDAIPALQKAAALAPQDPDIPARLGHVYLEKKDYPNAVQQLIVALKMNPDSNDVLGDLVTAQYLGKNYRAALQGLDVMSHREPLPVGSWFVRATCYDKLGQLFDALDAYQKFLQLNKDLNSDMYFEASARARTLARELKDKKR